MSQCIAQDAYKYLGDAQIIGYVNVGKTHKTNPGIMNAGTQDVTDLNLYLGANSLSSHKLLAPREAPRMQSRRVSCRPEFFVESGRLRSGRRFQAFGNHSEQCRTQTRRPPLWHHL